MEKPVEKPVEKLVEEREREFVCKKCGEVVGVGQFCSCKPYGCYHEITLKEALC